MTHVWNPGENPGIYSFVSSRSLLKNVTRTGFLNSFDNWLYLESNVFSQHDRNVAFFLPF